MTEMGAEVARPYMPPTGARNDWQTPRGVLDLVNAVGCIMFDPCTSDDNPTDANMYISPPGNGLEWDWRIGGGLVYVNPPYNELAAWAEKCAAEGVGRGVEIISLTPARTDTRAAQDYLFTAEAICFWRGRLRFVGAKDAAPFPSMLCYWGQKSDRFREVFSPHGHVIRP